jgi:hypothetical protein
MSEYILQLQKITNSKVHVVAGMEIHADEC